MTFHGFVLLSGYSVAFALLALWMRAHWGLPYGVSLALHLGVGFCVGVAVKRWGP